MTGIFCSPPSATSEEIDFTPRIQDLDGALELGASHRSYTYTTGGRRLNNENDTTYERLSIRAAGYVYHPRFVIYSVRGAGGLHEEKFDFNGDSRKNTRFSEEYAISTTLLPEHPYNLTLSAERRMITLPLLASGPDHITSTSESARFRYDIRPATLQLSAVSTRLEGHETYNARTFNASGSYLLGPLANFGAFSSTDYTTSDGSVGNLKGYSYGNDLRLSVFSLGSSIGRSQRVENGPQRGIAENDSLYWSENLGAALPLNFSVNLTHDYRDDTITIGQTQNAPGVDAFSRTDSDSLTLTHQLYRSVRSSFMERRTRSRSAGGETESTGQNLSVGYSKIIPSGNLNAGYNMLHSTQDRSGSPTITREFHSIPVPGTFTLSALAADPSSITVMVKDPVTDNLVLMPRYTSYDIVSVGNTQEIIVLNIPAGVNPPPPPAVNFEFLVTYSLQPSESTTEMRGSGISVDLVFLDGLINPYYSYFSSSQEVVSGFLPFGDDTTRSQTIGYNLHKEPFLLMAQYTASESQISPSRSLTTSAGYREDIYDDLNVSARVSYGSVFRPAVDGSGLTDDYSEETTGMEIQMSKVFPHNNLTLTAGGVYAQRSIVDIVIRTYSFKTGVNWRVGKLKINAGGMTGYSHSSGARLNQKNEAVSYYLTVSRNIF